jgi:hypothetical protein
LFRAPSVDQVINRSDRFFAVMPSVRVAAEAEDEETPKEEEAG